MPNLFFEKQMVTMVGLDKRDAVRSARAQFKSLLIRKYGEGCAFGFSYTTQTEDVADPPYGTLVQAHVVFYAVGLRRK